MFSSSAADCQRRCRSREPRLEGKEHRFLAGLVPRKNLHISSNTFASSTVYQDSSERR